MNDAFVKLTQGVAMGLFIGWALLPWSVFAPIANYHAGICIAAAICCVAERIKKV